MNLLGTESWLGICSSTPRKDQSSVSVSFLQLVRGGQKRWELPGGHWESRVLPQALCSRCFLCLEESFLGCSRHSAHNSKVNTSPTPHALFLCSIALFTVSFLLCIWSPVCCLAPPAWQAASEQDCSLSPPLGAKDSAGP